jgi:NADP-dependent 3-hydroxy acid dehydrogenase YdfG
LANDVSGTPLRRQVVIITGAAGGIGEATARRLSADGFHLVLGDCKADELAALAEQLRPGVVFVRTDVSSRQDVERLVAEAMHHFGRIDVLINNAGIASLAPLETGNPEDWERMIDVNLKGPLFAMKAVLPIMLSQNSGHIINVSSIAGRVPVQGAAVYGATKAALGALSEGLRKETAGRIKVTVLSPGGVATNLVAARPFSTPRLHAHTIADAIAFVINQPAEVAVNELVVRCLAEV